MIGYARYSEVSPMTVRRVTLKGPISYYQNQSIICGDYVAEVAEEAKVRFEWDEDVVDCSHTVFNCVNNLMFHPEIESLFVFPLQRFRSHRDANGFKLAEKEIQSNDRSFLFIGNPAKVLRQEDEAILVPRYNDLLIKSGPQLGF